MKKTSLAISISLVLGSLAASQLVSANPNGAQVVQGTASFSNPSTNVLNINNSRNAIINWQSFNIGAGQTTNFIQPSATSSVLNRVITNNPSQILGNLNSNGQVFLINQHGILVGEGANINTAGFFGSTLNITDADFLNGNLKFAGGGQGDFENQGYIHAGEDGSIVLIAPNIENGGVIEVDNGNVILAAGQSITITSLQNSAIQYEITSAENQVTNLGQIITKNGAVSLFAGTLKHSGSIRASGLVQNADGSISLVATNHVEVSGNVDVSGDKGGYIEILGNVVDIQNGAKVNASGTHGGGEILIGGDQQGLNPDIVNATSTSISKNAEVHADATDSGDGGKVIIFAENDVHVHGEVSAKGGVNRGDGGFIETSGLQMLDITSVPDASATNGKAGEWLIDPNNIDVIAGTTDPGYTSTFTSSVDSTQLGADLIVASLNAGTSVTISTGAGGTEAGDINIFSSIVKTAGGDASLTFNAHNNIVVDTLSTNQIDITSSSGILDVTFNPDIDGISGGEILFNTGAGNAFPITIGTNGGVFSSNGLVTISGESFVDFVDTNWIINSEFGLNLSGSFSPTTLKLSGTTVLQNDGEIGLVNANIIGDQASTNDELINNGEIIVGFSSTDTSIIDTTTLLYTHNGSIEILDLVTLNLTIDGTQALLNLKPGSGLMGGGTLNGDVEVNGGYLIGGDGHSAFGVLTINGDLIFNSGLFYTVVDAPDGIFSSAVSATTATINGGDLMVVWDSSFAPSGVFDGNSIQPLNCTGGAGCLNVPGLGFDTGVDPISVLQSDTDYGVTLADSITYKFTILDPARFTNIVTWIASTPGDWSDPANWADSAGNPVVPGASDYVFIENGNGPVTVDVTTLETFKGLQSHGTINITGSGNLSLGGDAFILEDFTPVFGRGLNISGAAATLSGIGVLYVAGPLLSLDEGMLQADVVSWSEVKITANSNFQIDSNLVNNGFMDVTDNTGVNTITGTGSLFNNGVLKVGANFDLNILFENRASGLLDIGLPGIDLRLTGGSKLDGMIDVIAGSALSLTGGNHTFVDGVKFNGDLNITGSVVAIEGGLNIGTLNFNGGVIDINSLGTGALFGNTMNASLINWGGGDGIISGDTSGAQTGVLDIGLTDRLVLTGNSNHRFIGLNVNHDGQIEVTAVGDSLTLISSRMTTTGTNLAMIGAGTVDLQTGSDWKISSAGMLMPEAMTLDLNGGSVTNVENLIFPGTVSFNQGSFVQNGLMTIPGTTTFNYFSNDDILPDFGVENNGIFIIQNNQSQMSMSIQNGTSFVNNGKFEIASATALSVFSEFINNGTLSLSSSSVVVAEAGSLITVNGGVIGAGLLSIGGGVLDFAAPTILPGTMALNLVSGSVTNAQNLTIPGNFTWKGGTVEGIGSGGLITEGAVTLTSGSLLDTDWTIAASGTVDWIGTELDSLTLTNASIINQGLFNITSQLSITPLASVNDTLAFKNLQGSGSSFINEGTLLINANDDTVDFGITFDNVGGDIGIVSGTFSLGGAELILGQGESLFGFGTFSGNVINTAGLVSPGITDELNSNFQIGTLTIDGNYTQGSNGTLAIKLDDSTDPVVGFQYDVLDVSGLLTADGTIDFKIISNSTITEIAALLDESFSPLVFGSFAGKFAASTPVELNTIFSIDAPVLDETPQQLLGEAANQLEVLLSSDNLDFIELVAVMQFLDPQARIAPNEDEDEEDLAPRLVCK